MNISVRKYYYQLIVALLAYLSLGALSSVTAGHRTFTFKVDGEEASIQVDDKKYPQYTLGNLFDELKKMNKLQTQLKDINVLYKGNTEIKTGSAGLLTSILSNDTDSHIKLTTKKPVPPQSVNNKNKNKGNKTNNNTNNNNSGNDDATDPNKTDEKGIWANYKRIIIGGSIGGVILLSGVGLIFLGQSKQENEKV